MGGGIAAGPEVVDRGNDAAAEEPSPHTVHEHALWKRRLGPADPSRQFPPAARPSRDGEIDGKHLRHAPGDDPATILFDPADPDRGVGRVGAILDDHRRQPRWQFRAEPAELGLDLRRARCGGSHPVGVWGSVGGLLLQLGALCLEPGGCGVDLGAA